MLLLEAALASWRLARLLVAEAGPDMIFARLRDATGIEYDGDGYVVSHPPYNPLHCQICTGIYTGFLVLLLPAFVRRALAISALTTIAAKVEQHWMDHG